MLRFNAENQIGNGLGLNSKKDPTVVGWGFKEVGKESAHTNRDNMIYIRHV